MERCYCVLLFCFALALHLSTCVAQDPPTVRIRDRMNMTFDEFTVLANRIHDFIQNRFRTLPAYPVGTSQSGSLDLPTGRLVDLVVTILDHTQQVCGMNPNHRVSVAGRQVLDGLQELWNALSGRLFGIRPGSAQGRNSQFGIDFRVEPFPLVIPPPPPSGESLMPSNDELLMPPNDELLMRTPTPTAHIHQDWQVLDESAYCAEYSYMSNIFEDVLYPGQSLYSPTRDYRLDMQWDCNLVLYTKVRQASVVWASGTNSDGSVQNCYVVMQQDGNLVLYNRDTAQSLWSTGTYCRMPNCYFPSFFTVQNDGNLVLYRIPGTSPSDAIAAWASNTFA